MVRIKKMLVEVKKYEVGKELFDTKEEAEHYEKLLTGERIVCDNCKGTKTDYGDDGRHKTICYNCKGKGYLEKLIIYK